MKSAPGITPHRFVESETGAVERLRFGQVPDVSGAHGPMTVPGGMPRHAHRPPR